MTVEMRNRHETSREHAQSPTTLLDVRDLRVELSTRRGLVHAVRGLSYSIAQGESLGLVGESGCGKSVSSLAVLGLLPEGTTRVSGSISFDGRELVGLPDSELRKIRATRIALVFQDPLSSLNPVLTIGRQITEVLEAHGILRGRSATVRAVELLDMVGIAEPSRRVQQYPHELSGGMRQRAMIAMALACDPSLLIADEPTTALDVTIQAQILELLDELRERLNMSLLLITHNLGVVARFTDRVALMYAGRIVEMGRTAEILETPKHPYTLGLLRSIPRLDRPRRSLLTPIPGTPPENSSEFVGCPFRARCTFAVSRCAVEDPPLEPIGVERGVACWVATSSPDSAKDPAQPVGTSAEPPPSAVLAGDRSETTTPLLAVTDLKVWFPVKGGPFQRTREWVRAVDGVSFSLFGGETLALVGESGSGKTTVARALVRANEPQEGSIRLDGIELLGLNTAHLRQYRRRVQMVFQDPYASLDPRQTIGQILAEPLRVHGLGDRTAQQERINELLQLVGLDPSFVSRHPFEFSGGQRQRVGIARALAVEPDLIVCDEPISALDVSIQAQISNLLVRLQNELGIAYVFIAHDLAIVRHLAHRVAVMYLGKIVEIAPAGQLYDSPTHPYTAALLSAIPVPDARIETSRARTILEGDVPSPINPPSGCYFHPRCPLRQKLGAPEVCSTVQPVLATRAEGPGEHLIACHFRDDMTINDRVEELNTEPVLVPHMKRAWQGVADDPPNEEGRT